MRQGVIERHPVLEGRELDQLPVMIVQNPVLSASKSTMTFYTERSAYEYLISEIAKVKAGISGHTEQPDPERLPGTQSVL